MFIHHDLDVFPDFKHATLHPLPHSYSSQKQTVLTALSRSAGEGSWIQKGDGVEHVPTVGDSCIIRQTRRVFQYIILHALMLLQLLSLGLSFCIWERGCSYSVHLYGGFGRIGITESFSQRTIYSFKP